MATLANGSPGPLGAATRRLVRSVDALKEDDWAAPSLLPGWTRAHLVAHLALNAEGLAGAVVGVVERRPVPMYATESARDDDIDVLATAEPGVIRDRLLGGVTLLADALASLAAGPPELGVTVIERTPGSSRRFPAAAVAHMRLREVEIHHVDLDVGYSPADWPEEFARDLLREGRERHPEIGPTIRGPVAGLAWWLTGRPPHPAAEVTSDDGVLPRIEGI